MCCSEFSDRPIALLFSWQPKFPSFHLSRSEIVYKPYLSLLSHCYNIHYNIAFVQRNEKSQKCRKVKKSNTKSKILYLARTLFSVGGGTLNLSLKRSLKIINQKKAAETESNGRSPMGQENGLAIERGQWRVDIGELILVIRFGIRFGIQLAISWVDRSPNP